MEINQLVLQNFRNITELNVTFNKKLNVIWGKNGQGKTNILEAISCLSLGKSFRTSSDRPLIQFTKPALYIGAKGTGLDGEFRVDLGYNGTAKKTKVNNVQMKRLVDFIGTIRTVSFSPDNLTLVKGGRAERRTFLDTMLAQISNKYCIDLATYNKIIEQRNKILKERPPQMKQLLTAWDMQLVQYASSIWMARAKAVREINGLTSEFFNEVADEEFEINVEFFPEIGQDYFEIYEETTQEELTQKLLATLQENVGLEIRRGYSLYGPHRDDLSIKINGMDSKMYASQGQQRLIALSMKIAEMHFIEGQTEDSPILLLDDILSELDQDKIDNLLEILVRKDRQIFITTAHKVNFPLDYQSWYMEKGILRRELE